jgi:hypothetical protein
MIKQGAMQRDGMARIAMRNPGKKRLFKISADHAESEAQAETLSADRAASQQSWRATR